MEQDWVTLMEGKSTEDLIVYITKSARYKREAVNAAIAELRKRGQIFSEEQLMAIHNPISEREKEENACELFFDRKVTQTYWRKNIVLDESAPSLYSEQLVFIFSTLFSPLAGAILIAINLNKIEKKKEGVITFFFGLVYYILIIWINEFTSPKTSSTAPAFLLGMLGGIILIRFFWRKYIGVNTKYRARPFWIPLIIGVIICVFMARGLIYGQ